MKLRTTRRGFFGVAGALTSAALPAKESASPIDIADRKQLFIDRKFIERGHGITLAQNPPRKVRPVLYPDRPWDKRQVGPYATVLEHEGVLKMWYLIRGEGVWTHGYATSTNGVEWQKPALGQVEFDGSKANNLVLRNSTGQGAVCFDPVAPPHQRFKLLASDAAEAPSPLGTVRRNAGLMLLCSPDGLRWTEEFKVLPFGVDTQNQVMWDARVGKYVAYLRGWNPGRVVLRCEIAKEAITQPWPHTPAAKPRYLWMVFEGRENWLPALSTELPTVMAADEQDPPNCDLYSPVVSIYPWADNVYLAFPSLFRHTAPPGTEKVPRLGPVDVHMAASRDGIRWHRPERQPYLGMGMPGTEEARQVYMATGLVRRGNDIYHYYGGVEADHGLPPKKSAIHLAVQRLDGFVSVDTKTEEGEVVTPLLTFQGRKLTLNIDTTALGSATVELTDAEGLPLPGFELRNSEPVIGNEVAYEVRWRGEPDLGRFQGRPVRLRLRMRNARLYAFQFA
jgi:hypothetical protein